jgi:hypothetical protein
MEGNYSRVALKGNAMLAIGSNTLALRSTSICDDRDK